MKKLVAGLFSMAAMGSLSVGCVVEQGVPEHADLGARDPLGVDLEAVGLSAGDKPCGDYAHVASVVNEGRYLAFCAGASRDAFVVQVTPGGVAPKGSSGGCALDIYLAATPNDAAVPKELLDACEQSSLGARHVSTEPVLVRDIVVVPPIILNPNNDCSNSSLFESTRCAAIDDYTGDVNVQDSVSWCGLGPYAGNAQRTASVQGLPTAFEGRMTVAACGSATTNIKGWVKRSNGTWVNTPGDNINVSPFHVVTINIHHYDVTDGSGLPDGVDLRFTVTPSAGASYRYTGAFVEYFPVP